METELQTVTHIEKPSSARHVQPPGRRSERLRVLTNLSTQEVLILLFALLFSTISLAAISLGIDWPQVIVRMVAASSVIYGMNYWALRTKSPSGPLQRGAWRDAVKLFYIIPLIPVFFKTSEYISFPLHGHDFDSLLIVADRMMFAGANPTQWLYEHFPHFPALTEYMTICYSLFYFLPTGLAVELYRGHPSKGGPRSSRRRETDELFFIIVYGFLLSYISYFLIPSIGPRFTLHSFSDLSKDLPGIWLTEPIRTLLNRGEGIIRGMTSAEAIHAVTRDAFPSGHADITLLTMILAFHYRARLRWPILVLGSSLLFSTVYLRYHYVVDLIGGGVLSIVTLYTWRWARERTKQIQRTATRVLPRSFTAR